MDLHTVVSLGSPFKYKTHRRKKLISAFISENLKREVILFLLKPTLGTFDHADVVGAIADSQSYRLLVLLDQLHHLGLLQRRHPAADHRFTQTRRPEELQLHAALQGVRLSHKTRSITHKHPGSLIRWPVEGAVVTHQTVSVDNESILPIGLLVFHQIVTLLLWQKQAVRCSIWFHGVLCISAPKIKTTAG